METRNSGLLIHIRTKSTHPLGFTNVDGKVKLRRMKMIKLTIQRKSIMQPFMFVYRKKMAMLLLLESVKATVSQIRKI